jgi:hypothetical protein
MVIFKVYYAHGFFYCFHFMTFLKDMFRESEFAFCVSEIFHMFFKSRVEVSVVSSYIKFVEVGACQFIKVYIIKYLNLPLSKLRAQFTRNI